MAEQIADIEQRRYVELSKRHAAQGYSTPPEVMLEIADLYQKYGPVELLGQARPHPERRRELDLDIKFLIAQIGSLTHRQLHIERALGWVTRATIGCIAGLVLLSAVVLVLR